MLILVYYRRSRAWMIIRWMTSSAANLLWILACVLAIIWWWFRYYCVHIDCEFSHITPLPFFSLSLQLQLSTLSPSQQNSLKQKVMNGAALKQAVSRSIINCGEPSTSTASSSGCKRVNNSDDNGAPEKQRTRTDEGTSDESKSPIKSLSSMVSSPINTTVQSMNHNFYKTPSPSPAVPSDPISANLTSCLCKRLSISCNNNCEQRPSTSTAATTNDNEPCCSSSLQKPAPRLIPFHQRPVSNSSVIIKPKQMPPQPKTDSSTSNDTQLLNIDNPALAEASRNLTQTLRKLSKRVFTSKAHIMENSVINRNLTSSSSSSSSSSTSSPPNGSSASNASSNQLITNSSSSGAVIESMKHHGKGIYSGTFSGTLNPALQDKNGRPKRDISTIIHILNDLLSATPNCTKNGTKIFFEPTQPSSSSSSSVQSSSSSTKYIKVSCACTFWQCFIEFRFFASIRSRNKARGHAQDVFLMFNKSVHTGSAMDIQRLNWHHHQLMGTTVRRFFINFESFLMPKISVSDMRNDCTECYQTLMSQKLEMENMKTKSKLDQLKLVMQQKKERREARKLKIAPYNTAQHIPSPSASISTVTTPVPTHVSPSSSSVNGNNLNRMNSDASATAITISSENHMEEVETVA